MIAGPQSGGIAIGWTMRTVLTLLSLSAARSSLAVDTSTSLVALAAASAAAAIAPRAAATAPTTISSASRRSRTAAILAACIPHFPVCFALILVVCDDAQVRVGDRVTQ